MTTTRKLKEVKAALRELERKGIVESCIIDGEVRWRLTAKGDALGSLDFLGDGTRTGGIKHTGLDRWLGDDTGEDRLKN